MDLGDLAAHGNRQYLAKMFAAVQVGWMEFGDGFIAASTGLPIPALNSVTVSGPVDPALVERPLRRLAASGLPFSLQVRPQQVDSVAELVTAFGMKAAAGLPLMIHEAAARAPAVSGLSIRRLSPRECSIHGELFSHVYEIPRDLVDALLTPEAVASPGVQILVGEVDGRAVTTALTDINDDVAWIFNVATLESHRGRGYGAAITAAAVTAAREAGARLTCLLSSPAGEGVYRSLGFRQIEWWSLWARLTPA